MPAFNRILSAALVACVSVSGAEIVAHRGASKDAPENTLASMRLAYEQGADGVECDIYRTADGKIAVIHDVSTKRTTGTEGNVEKMTLAEVQALDAGSWMNRKFAGEKIPSLEELFSVVPDGKSVFVELKGGEELVSPLKETVARAKKKNEQIVFISFNYGALKAVKKEFPQNLALLLASYSKDKEGKPKLTLEDAIKKAKDANLDGLSLSSGWPIDADFVKKIHDAGMKLSVWTVNDAELAKKLVAAGADVICTDKPGFLRDALGK